MNKEDLLKEWKFLTNDYKLQGLMEDMKEAFLAGRIIETEFLLSYHFELNISFFQKKDSLESIGIDLSKPFTFKDQNIKDEG